jgi:hypothetical protein
VRKYSSLSFRVGAKRKTWLCLIKSFCTTGKDLAFFELPRCQSALEHGSTTMGSSNADHREDYTVCPSQFCGKATERLNSLFGNHLNAAAPLFLCAAAVERHEN